jgi:two-component system, OmpR family, sensor histidine kinase QseC
VSLRRRLLLYLLLCAPAVWSVALWVSVDRARHEVNEMFDTEMIRLARQVQSTLNHRVAPGQAGTTPLPAPGTAEAGEADVRDLAIAVWDAQGERLLADREGVQLPRRAQASGFVDAPLGGEDWRIYYLQSFSGEWLVAAGQKIHERDEMVYNLTASQIGPWLVVLPVLLLAMAWAVRRALAPVDRLAKEVRSRGADDLRSLPAGQAPQEIRPLVEAMNALFARISKVIESERRFTADAAHELRTPLAALRGQWDVLCHASTPVERAECEAKVSAGLERLDRLVTQMLALAQVESSVRLPAPTPIDWYAAVEQTVSDCLPLAERRHMELACEWPQDGKPPLPLVGHAHLITVLLRNLLDNALRYAPMRTLVTLRVLEDRLEVDNDAQPLPAEAWARIGEPFHRPEGQAESGSGLGVSIARRIAALHGLSVRIGPRDGGLGVRVTVRAEQAPPPATGS